MIGGLARWLHRSTAEDPFMEPTWSMSQAYAWLLGGVALISTGVIASALGYGVELLALWVGGAH